MAILDGVRTTINIDEHLLERIREISLRTHRSVSQVMEDGLRFYLEKKKRRQASANLRLVTFGEGGVLPGVDLDDSAALLETMENSRAPL